MLGYRYYRTQLNQSSQTIYDKVVAAMENCRDQIYIPYTDADEISRILTAADLDQPGLFHVLFGETQLGYIGTKHFLRFSYCMKGDTLKQARIRLRQEANRILNQMKGYRPSDPFLYLHDHLVTNTVYGSKEDRKHDAHTIYGALIDHECVCEGYAKAYRFLCTLASLQCIVAAGDAHVPHETPGLHAWNLIRDQGRLYHVDVTFDHLIRGKYCSRAYYRLNEKQILTDHSFDPLFELPHAVHESSYLPTIGGTARLIAFLKTESQLGKPMSQARLTKGFGMDEIIQKIEKGLNMKDYLWFERLDSYYYHDDARTITFIWKNTS